MEPRPRPYRCSKCGWTQEPGWRDGAWRLKGGVPEGCAKECKLSELAWIGKEWMPSGAS